MLKPVILRCDFLSRHNAVTDLRERHLKLWNWSVPLLCSQATDPLRSAMTLKPILIPARSQMSVLGHIHPKIGEKEFTCNYVGLLDPDVQTLLGLFVVRTVTSVKVGVTCVRAMNMTGEDCHVPSGTRLREFHFLVAQPGEGYTTTVAHIQAQIEPGPRPKTDPSQSALKL